MSVEVYKIKQSKKDYTFSARDDDQCKALQEQIKNIEENGELTFHSVIPQLEDGHTESNLIIFTENNNESEVAEVRICDADTEEVLFEYNRANVSELLLAVKNSDEFQINHEETNFKGKFSHSKFQIENDRGSIIEIVSLYFKKIN